MSPEAEYFRLFLSLTTLFVSAAQRHNPLLDDPLAAARFRDKTPIEDSGPSSRQSSRLRQSSLTLLDDPLLDTVTSLSRQSLLDELLSAGYFINF